jgi:hypothetical protein
MLKDQGNGDLRRGGLVSHDVTQDYNLHLHT